MMNQAQAWGQYCELGRHGPGSFLLLIYLFWDFLGGPVVKSLPADAGETGYIPDPRGSHRPRALRMMSSCQWARLLSGDLDKNPLANTFKFSIKFCHFHL